MNKMHIRVYEDSDNFVRGIQVHSFDKFFFLILVIGLVSV